MSAAILTALVAIAGLALVAAALRTMSIAQRADEIADHHWGELAHLQSASGVAFFPTTDARLELEMALTELLELAPAAPVPRPPPAPPRRPGTSWSDAASALSRR